MLPSLHELSVSFEETGPPAVKNVTIKKKSKKKPQKTYLEEQFPVDTPTTIMPETLFSLPRIVKEFDDSRWVFSAYSAITALRFESTSLIGDPYVGGDLVEAFKSIDVLEDRFGNQLYNPARCGSYNCFIPFFSIEGNDVVKKALFKIIAALHEGVPGFVMPKTVSIRAPLKSKAWVYSESKTRAARDEVALTLYMAKENISPQVYATFPVKTTGRGFGVVIKDFAYVTESGWIDFHDLLDDLRITHPLAEEYIAAVDSISKSVIELFRKVADTDMLLTDIKLTNMVARRESGTTYEVKMIDFGAYFTFDLNKFVRFQNEFTTSKCVFFVNTLLLANYVLSRQKAGADHRHVFKALVNEAVKIWEEMISKDSFTGFCDILRRDESFPLALLDKFDQVNMQIVPESEYVEKSRYTFYRMLINYGNDDVLGVNDLKKYSDPYITRVVEKLKILFL